MTKNPEPIANISIDVNSDGSLSWKASGLSSGIPVMSVLSATILDMYAYYFEHPARPPLPEQDMQVCIEMKNDALAIKYSPVAMPDMAMAICHAAFVALYNRMEEPGFDPLEGVFGGLLFKDDGEGLK